MAWSRAYSAVGVFVGVLVAVGAPAVWGQQSASTQPTGAAQWPPKRSRSLVSDSQIERARSLCGSDQNAQNILRDLLSRAQPWLAFSDEQLRDMLPDGRVPRAFDLSTLGCPVHGQEVFKFGTYPWVLDPDHPYSVICPVGRERYPSNDFEAYYRGGMKDRTLLTGPYADDGWGWKSPAGEKYWFVACGCHWTWKRRWLPAVSALSQAYVLTGDRRYAEKCVAMLDRIAEVYPGMDYSRQSRMGELKAGKYKGKIENHIWETFVLRDLAIAYDGVFDTLIGNQPISLPWRDSESIRANIEAGILDEGLKAVLRGDVQGDFGMHQSAFAYTLAVRQTGAMGDSCQGILHNTGDTLDSEGLDYAFYNLVYKDGMPYETSPFYCSNWVKSLVDLAKPLSEVGIDLYSQARFRSLLNAPLDLMCAGGFTPAIGDAGSIKDRWIGPDATCYEAAYRHYGDARYAWAIKQSDSRWREIRSYEDLFKPPLESAKVEQDAKSYAPRPSSRVLDGYGAAILNNRQNNLAVSMFYGPRSDHGHYDRLNIEVFGGERRLSPDLGYPDFMNAYVSGIYTWTKNTISHNCVAVDAGRQEGNEPGKVLRFHESPTVHVVDVDASAGSSYTQADVYRRTLVLVETDEHNGYLVDVFRVRGGKRHVLSVHGGEGEFTLKGAPLSPPVTQGTLAGANVPYGQPYDDPKLVDAVPGRSYVGYKGSGYSHFINWQRADASEGFLTGLWQFKDAPGANLQIHIAPAAGQKMIVADAYVSPARKTPAILKYMLAERDAATEGDVFVTVWEPFEGKSGIEEVRLHTGLSERRGSDQVVGLSVHRGSAVDVITVAPDASKNYSLGETITSDAAVAVLTIEAGQATRVFAAGGSALTGGADQKTLAIPATIRGDVQSVDFTSGTVTASTVPALAAPETLVGRAVRIFNDRHSCLYVVASAQASNGQLVLKLSGSDILTGRIRAKRIDPTARSITTDTNLMNRSRLVGMHMNADGQHLGRIESIQDGTFRLDERASRELGVLASNHFSGDAWIADFGPGDHVEIEQGIYSRIAARSQ